MWSDYRVFGIYAMAVFLLLHSGGFNAAFIRAEVTMTHDRSGFHCGEPLLGEYSLKYAAQQSRFMSALGSPHSRTCPRSCTCRFVDAPPD
jgi:hypothetical protein